MGPREPQLKQRVSDSTGTPLSKEASITYRVDLAFGFVTFGKKHNFNVIKDMHTINIAFKIEKVLILVLNCS